MHGCIGNIIFEMKKYEYMTISQLSEMAMKGWRLITVNNGYAYFERELADIKIKL